MSGPAKQIDGDAHRMEFGATATKPTRVTIVAAALPPKLDGIGDYTARLAAELATDPTLHVQILTDRTATPDLIPNVCIEGVFDPDDPPTVNQLFEAVKQSPPDWLLLQYNPFSYGRRGLNLHLPKVMRRLRRDVPGLRLAIMFHEMFVPVKHWKFAVMTTYQRWQFHQLCRTGDVLFFSIDPWARHWAKRFPQKPVHHLPVGSNLPRLPISPSEAKQRLGLPANEMVLGMFGTAHISRCLHLLRPAAQGVQAAGQQARILYVGPDEPAVRRAAGDIPIIAGGRLPADDVSRWLSAVDIFLAAYSDGISTRRGAMMAAMQHALAIVGTVNCNTDAELKRLNGTALLLTDVSPPAPFAKAVGILARDAPRRADMGGRALQWFERHYSWPAIARKMMSLLRAAP